MEQHITSENASDNLLLGQDPGSVSSVFAVDARNRNHTVIYLSLIHISEPTRPY